MKKRAAHTKAKNGVTKIPALVTTHVTKPDNNETHSVEESQEGENSGVQTTELLEYLHTLRETYQKANVDKVTYIEDDYIKSASANLWGQLPLSYTSWDMDESNEYKLYTLLDNKAYFEMREPKNGREEGRIAASTHRQSRLEYVHAVSKLHFPELKSVSGCDLNVLRTSNAREAVNRAHITEVFQYKEETMGIPTRGQEQPAYTWEDISSFRESDPLVNTKENVKPLSSLRSDPIRYIPTDIRGDPEFVKAVTELCTEYIDIFSTVVSEEPARVPPMELEVDTTLWERNANKGPPRKQTPDKHEAIVRETDKLVQHKIIAPSQAEYYSQVNMVPKPVYTHRSEELDIPDKAVKAKGRRTTIDYKI